MKNYSNVMITDSLQVTMVKKGEGGRDTGRQEGRKAGGKEGGRGSFSQHIQSVVGATSCAKSASCVMQSGRYNKQ